MPRESSIKRSIMQHLNAIDGCIFRKRGPGSTAGDPDVYGSYFGQHVELEIKRPGEQPTPLQRQRLREWAQAGATCAVVRSVTDAEVAVTLSKGHVYERGEYGMTRCRWEDGDV